MKYQVSRKVALLIAKELGKIAPADIVEATMLEFLSISTVELDKTKSSVYRYEHDKSGGNSTDVIIIKKPNRSLVLFHLVNAQNVGKMITTDNGTVFNMYALYIAYSNYVNILAELKKAKKQLPEFWKFSCKLDSVAEGATGW